jgi:acetylglutamate synthase
LLAAKGFAFFPERLTWRGRRDAPVNDWYMASQLLCR